MFAQIERVERELWLIAFPPWSVQRHPQLKTKKGRYANPKTAKKHFEACGACKLAKYRTHRLLTYRSGDPPRRQRARYAVRSSNCTLTLSLYSSMFRARIEVLRTVAQSVVTETEANSTNNWPANAI
jgi:hypothetical protein